MKTFRMMAAAVLGLFMSLPLSALAEEGDPILGREKAYTCMGCHAIDGYRNAYPAFRVPRIGGQHAQYIVSSLQAYKNGDRRHPTMQAIAGTLSEQDKWDIAAYFEALGRSETP